MGVVAGCADLPTLVRFVLDSGSVDGTEEQVWAQFCGMVRWAWSAESVHSCYSRYQVPV